MDTIKPPMQMLEFVNNLTSYTNTKGYLEVRT